MAVGDATAYEGWEVIASTSGGYASRFRLIVGPDNVARALELDADGPRGLRRLSVRRNQKGHWWVDGKRRTDLDGSLDIDVAATPLTNTPTIRRVDLAVGGAADLVVAWVDVPSLAIDAREQRYERLPGPERPVGGAAESLPAPETADAADAAAADAPARFAFSAGEFRAWITTDPDGVVRDYEGFAERLHRR